MQAFNDMNMVETIFFVLIVYSPYYLPVAFIAILLLVLALYLMKKRAAAKHMAVFVTACIVVLTLLGIVLGAAI